MYKRESTFLAILLIINPLIILAFQNFTPFNYNKYKGKSYKEVQKQDFASKERKSVFFGSQTK